MMAQLVNLQNGELLEIPAGESLIGRGPLLKVTDKRVSRNHAALRLENGVLHICPKHKNPTFFKAAADKGSYSMLAKEQWQKLEDKDCFSLLPNDLVFRVVGGKMAAEGAPKDTAGCQTSQTCSDSKDILDEIFGGTESKDESTTSTVSKGTEKTENKVEENATSLKHNPTLPTLELADETPPSSSVLNGDSSISTAKPAAPPPPPPQTSTSSVSSQPAMKPSLSTSNKRRNLPSWLQSISSDDLSPLPPVKKQRTAVSPTSSTLPPPPGAKAAPGHKPTASKHPGSKTTRAPVSKTVTKTNAASKRTDSAAKAASSVDAPPQLDKGSSPTRDGKEAVRTAGDGGAGREDVKMAVSESPKAGTYRPPKKAEDADKEDKALPLCPYGTKCYRKNPAHFKEYSHSSTRAVTADGHSGSEGEEEDAAKPVCPYGASCYRKNPAHFVEFSHSSSPVQGAESRRRRRKKTKGTKPSALAGDSDDEGGPNTYDYNDSFIDDGNDGSGSSTSYAGDSSDSDWAPEGGGGGGGGRMEDNGEEEVAELLADAQAFIGNKKMRR